MMRHTGALASLLASSVAACPGPTPGDGTGGSTTSASTGHESSGGVTTTATSGGTTSGGTTSGGTTSGGTTSGGTTVTEVTSTTGDETAGPLDVTCTYPGSTSADPLSPDVAPECACVNENGFLTCASALCPSISGDCVGGGTFDSVCYGEWMYNEAALDCALAAARDGAQGTLRWHFSANSGFSYHAGFLHIVADRRAIRQDVDWVDLSGEVSDTELWQLRDPQYFQGCIDLPTFCARLHCFFAGATGNALSLCLPGFYDTDL